MLKPWHHISNTFTCCTKNLHCPGSDVLQPWVHCVLSTDIRKGLLLSSVLLTTNKTLVTKVTWVLLLSCAVVFLFPKKAIFPLPLWRCIGSSDEAGLHCAQPWRWVPLDRPCGLYKEQKQAGTLGWGVAGDGSLRTVPVEVASPRTSCVVPAFLQALLQHLWERWPSPGKLLLIHPRTSISRPPGLLQPYC